MLRLFLSFYDIAGSYAVVWFSESSSLMVLDLVIDCWGSVLILGITILFDVCIISKED